MTTSILSYLVTKWPRVLLLAFIFVQSGNSVRADLYAPGDIVANHTFYARRAFTRPDGTPVSAGEQVKIKDFPGHIIFLEWFAVWCPYCQAAVPQVEEGIVDWYALRGGNPHGIPVLYVFVNQESSSVYQPSTTTYINSHLDSSTIVLDDYAFIGGPNLVRPYFQSSGQPIFGIINSVTNSPTHQPWQLLENYLGYGETDFETTLAGFRDLIDSVQPPAVPLFMTNPQHNDSDFEFSFQTLPGQTYRVQSSTNLISWTTLTTISGTNIPTVFHHTNAPPTQQFYRVVTP